jgi:hypothetical protein
MRQPNDLTEKWKTFFNLHRTASITVNSSQTTAYPTITI